MQINCDVCGLEMKVQKHFKSRKGKKGKVFRVRRFVCSCGYTKMVFADGYQDEVMEPMAAVSVVKKLYKQQEDN